MVRVIKKDRRQSRKANGVGSSWFLSRWALMTLNIASMSSWECPELKNEIWAPPSLWRQIHDPTKRRTPTFLTSFEELSAWRLSQTDLKSILAASLLRPADKISHVLELPEVTRLGLRARRTMWPCTNKLVLVSRGRLKLENSLLFIERLRGHACFAASIESSMAVISSWPNVVAASLDLARAA